MTDVAITLLPDAPLHVFEIWSHPAAVATRFKASTGFALPATGRSGGDARLRLIRFEPTVWLVDGDVAALAAVLADDGALTDIGGGVARVRLSGAGWRRLLMEGGVIDAECPAFAPGCSAATIVDHIPVRLDVIDADICDAYVPRSFSKSIIHFWNLAAADMRA